MCHDCLSPLAEYLSSARKLRRENRAVRSRWPRIKCLYGTTRSVGWLQLPRKTVSCIVFCWVAVHADFFYTASIQKILNLNQDPPPSEDGSLDPSSLVVSQSSPILNEDGDPVWKVLVFDSMGRDIISSVLRVNDLRAWGVTIHLY